MRALISTHCLLLGLIFSFGLIALATAIQASNMDTPQSKDSVMPLKKTTQPQGLIQDKSDKDETVQVILYDSKAGDEPNLDCNDKDTDLAVSCDYLPFGDCCNGGDGELFDSVWHDRTRGWKMFSAYAGDDDDPCRQVITSTGTDKCLAGSSVGMSITGGAVLKKKDMDGTEDDRGPGKREQEVDKDEKRKYKVHRASLYTAQHKNGTFYHVRMKSKLGDEYRKLASRKEKKVFILANGFPKGNFYGGGGREEDQQEEKRLEEESTGELLNGD